MNSKDFKKVANVATLAAAGAFLAACDTTPRQMIQNTVGAVENTVGSVVSPRNDTVPNYQATRPSDQSEFIYKDAKGILRAKADDEVLRPATKVSCSQSANAQRSGNLAGVISSAGNRGGNAVERILSNPRRGDSVGETLGRAGQAVFGNVTGIVYRGAVGAGVNAAKEVFIENTEANCFQQRARDDFDLAKKGYERKIETCAKSYKGGMVEADAHCRSNFPEPAIIRGNYGPSR